MKALLKLIICILITLASNKCIAQCSATIINNGKGCSGDTLKINVKGATSISWKRNNKIIKSLAPVGTYGVTVAGSKDSIPGFDSAHLYYPTGITLDKKGNLYVVSALGLLKWAPGALYGTLAATSATSNVYVDDSENVYVCSGDSVFKWKPGAIKGVGIAGNKHGVGDSLHVGSAEGLYVDSAGYIYISDYDNSRVEKWKPGAKYGHTVAGQKDGSSGTDSAHLRWPHGICVDNKGTVYVADDYNNRIQKWTAGAKFGVTVAGQENISFGSDSSHLNSPTDVYVDKLGNVYVADNDNNRIQKWAPGANFGITVAGQKDGTPGKDSTHLNHPWSIFLDTSGNIFISDYANHRVQKWSQGPTSFNGTYTLIAEMPGSYYVEVTDTSGCKAVSNTIVLNPPSSYTLNTCITTGHSYLFNGSTYNIAGTYTTLLTNAAGCDSLVTLNLFVNKITTIINAYICMGQSYNFSGSYYTSSGAYTVYDTTKAGCDSIITLNLNVHSASNSSVKACIFSGQPYSLNGRNFSTSGIYYDTILNKAGCDSIIKLDLSVSNALLSSVGSNCPGEVLSTSLKQAKLLEWIKGNQIVQINTPANGYGAVVAGKEYIQGRDSSLLNGPSSIFVDDSDNLFIADNGNSRVQEWKRGTSFGITVAGKNDSTISSDSAHLSGAASVFVDKGGNIYVSDVNNNRIQKWSPGAKYGITVAGQTDGTPGIDNTHLSNPLGVFVDKLGNIYIADTRNQRVEKWAPNATKGVTIAGGYSPGHHNYTDSNILALPSAVYVDDSGNIYISDTYNNRIQKWAPGANYGKTVAGQKDGSPGSDSTHLNTPHGLFVDSDGNIYIADANNQRIQMWSRGAKFGITVAGRKFGSLIPDSGNLSWPYSVSLDRTGNIFIADVDEHCIKKWAQDSTTLSGTYSFKTFAPGIYNAVVYYDSGCAAISDTVRIYNCANDLTQIEEKHLFIRVYPNPNSGLFSVELYAPDLGTVNGRLILTDAIGRSIITTDVTIDNGYLKYNTDLHNQLASGVYILTLISGDKQYNQRVVVSDK